MQPEESTEFLSSVVTFCPVVAFRNHASNATLMSEPRWFTSVELTQNGPRGEHPFGVPRKVIGYSEGTAVVALEVAVVASSTVEKNVVVAVDATMTVETEVIVCSLTLPTRQPTPAPAAIATTNRAAIAPFLLP